MGGRRRFGCVRDGAVLLLGSPETHPEIVYVTGFRAPDSVAVLLTEQATWLAVSSMEVGRARRVAEGARVVTPEALCGSRRALRRSGRWLARLCREAGVRRVRVPPTFPHGAAERLQRDGVRVTTVREPLFPERAVKTEAELAEITASQRAAVRGMRAAIERLRRAGINARGELVEGRRVLTSEAVRRTIMQATLEEDCLARETIVAGGAQGADPHEVGEGPLRAGEAIVIDIFPQNTRLGYYGDLTRTVCKGAPSPELKRRYAAVHAAQRAALAVLRAGVSARQVHLAAVAALEERGYTTGEREGRPVGFFHSTGHGVGLSIHEAPAVAAGNRERLRRGQVVTVEPGLYDPDIGGIRIEDTVVVTATGWRLLAACPTRFGV